MNKQLNVLAIFLSFTALIVSFWQASISQKAVSLSVQPFVQITPYLEGPGGRNGIFIANIGLGPAVFLDATIQINGKETSITEDNWQSLLQEIKVNDLCFSKSWLPKGSGLAKEKEVPIISLGRTDSPACTLDLITLLGQNNISIKLIYKSMTNDFYEKTEILPGSNIIKDVQRALQNQ